MPTFYFNVHCSNYEITDLVGEKCRNSTMARVEALRTAREIIQDALLSGSFPQDGWIEVEDEEHRPVLTLPLRQAAC